MKNPVRSLITGLLIIASLTAGATSCGQPATETTPTAGYNNDVADNPITQNAPTISIPTNTTAPSGCENLPLLPVVDNVRIQFNPQHPDDLMGTPGGIAYAGNFHQAGVPDTWPAIETTTVQLTVGQKIINISYRRDISTAAGETRNCIFSVSDIDPTDTNNTLVLYSKSLPKEFTLSEFGTGSLGRPGLLASVLVIEVPKGLPIGQYQFSIGVCAAGIDYGLFPITVTVIDTPTPALPRQTS